MGLGCLSEPKSKLGLPRVTTGLNKFLNQSSQGNLKKQICYTSSNGPPRNCCTIPDKYLIGHVLGGQNGGFTQTFQTLLIITHFYWQPTLMYFRKQKLNN